MQKPKYEIRLMPSYCGHYGLFGEIYRGPLAINERIQPLVDYLIPTGPFLLEIFDDRDLEVSKPPRASLPHQAASHLYERGK